MKIFLDNFDLYFVEIKWVGFCAKRVRGRSEITAERPTEFGVSRAKDGAYQTKRYIENNNALEYDHRIRLGIFLVYDAYPDGIIPITYGPEIEEFPLLEIMEYHLATKLPSQETRGITSYKDHG